MRQNKISREEFWMTNEIVEKEISDFLRTEETDDGLSFVDAWLTLICC